MLSVCSLWEACSQATTNMTVLPVLLYLVLLGSNYVLPLTNHYDSSDINVKKKIALFHKLWKRQLNCPSDEYLADKHCCKNCMEGTYAQSDCDTDHGYSDCKACTEGENYTDKKNGYPHCLRCHSCDSMSVNIYQLCGAPWDCREMRVETATGQELLQNCTASKNAKCKCRKSFFCKGNSSDSEDCPDCQHCTQCEYGVKEPCTATKDTVCKSPRRRDVLWAAFGVCSVFAAVFAAIFIYNMCKSPGSNEKQVETEHPQKPAETEHPQRPILPDYLQDIDLTDYLFPFTEQMELTTVLMCIRKMHMNETTIGDVMHDNETLGAKEQRYQLLKCWYESHGKAGAFKSLITTLQSNNNINCADKLIQLVKRQNLE